MLPACRDVFNDQIKQKNLSETTNPVRVSFQGARQESEELREYALHTVLAAYRNTKHHLVSRQYSINPSLLQRRRRSLGKPQITLETIDESNLLKETPSTPYLLQRVLLSWFIQHQKRMKLVL